MRRIFIAICILFLTAAAAWAAESSGAGAATEPAAPATPDAELGGGCQLPSAEQLQALESGETSEEEFTDWARQAGFDVVDPALVPTAGACPVTSQCPAVGNCGPVGLCAISLTGMQCCTRGGLAFCCLNGNIRVTTCNCGCTGNPCSPLCGGQQVTISCR